jgi:hypothetical protein
MTKYFEASVCRILDLLGLTASHVLINSITANKTSRTVIPNSGASIEFATQPPRFGLVIAQVQALRLRTRQTGNSAKTWSLGQVTGSASEYKCFRLPVDLSHTHITTSQQFRHIVATQT